MCGIAGEVGSPQSAPGVTAGPDGEALRILRHRGPDDSGQYEDHRHGVRLLHRRLSIIDLSAAGHQPMTDPARQTVVVFNGEIYNYRELDEQLRNRGYRYRSQSDTETILHAYAEWGEDCVRHFNGMFAFALWDAPRRTLFCARDRFGEKPFYYHQRPDGSMVFASEVKALLPFDNVPRAPNLDALRYFLTTGLSRPGSTFFEDIKELAPGSTLMWRTGQVTTRRYWEIPRRRVPPRRTPDEWAEIFLDGMRSAIKLRLRSDVPVGTCLSGGLDSSTIVTLMRELHSGPISCFSVLYDEAGLSERQFVEALAEETRLQTHVSTPDGSDLLDTLQDIAWHNDQPSGSRGQYSQWHAMKLAAQHGVVVLLNGQGGDELLGGYDRYVPTALRSLVYAGRPLDAWRLARSFATVRDCEPSDFVKQATYPLFPAALRNAWRLRRFQPAALAGPALGSPIAYAESPLFDLRSHLVADLTQLSVPGLVHDEDRCSMAFSREIRLPFLDHNLVESLIDAPLEMRLADGQTKVLLRHAMRGRLAERVRTRTDKLGYPTPVGRWLRTTASREAEAVIRSPEFRSRGFIDPDIATQLLSQHVEGKADNSVYLWQCLGVEYWARTFIDRPPQARS